MTTALPAFVKENPQDFVVTKGYLPRSQLQDLLDRYVALWEQVAFSPSR